MQNKHSNSTRKNQWKFTCSMTIFQKISPIHCRRKREGDFPFENTGTCTDNIKTNDQFFLHICSRQVYFLKIKPHKPDSKIGIKPLHEHWTTGTTLSDKPKEKNWLIQVFRHLAQWLKPFLNSLYLLPNKLFSTEFNKLLFPGKLFSRDFWATRIFVNISSQNQSFSFFFLFMLSFPYHKILVLLLQTRTLGRVSQITVPSHYAWCENMIDAIKFYCAKLRTLIPLMKETNHWLPCRYLVNILSQ